MSDEERSRGRRVVTVGHSTRTLEELVDVLGAHGVDLLVDVRTVPRSRRVPWFDAATLGAALAPHGIGYVHLAALGGLRGKKKGGPSRNDGWENASFRNYADYAETAAFARGLDALVATLRTNAPAIMCAEATWWRCHRRIITDYLLVRGIEVVHAFDARKVEPATMTPFAAPQPDGTVAYPARLATAVHAREGAARATSTREGPTRVRRAGGTA